MAKVVLEHLGKRYPSGVCALEDLSLTMDDGELVVLVGPSGCGKTTTLRLLAGLEEPTTGVIRIGERDVTRLPSRERQVALVFQQPALYPHLTVAENLTFGPRIREGSGILRRILRREEAAQREREQAAQVEDVARTLGLVDLLDRRPDQMSGGQQQRVALGRALMRRPAVFLLDEPLSSLEPTLRYEMRRELHLLQRRLRATMVYVTHDQVEALTLADRVVVLDGGKVQQVGRPLDVYDRPDSAFVAGFIGWPPMNFLDGRVGRDSAGRLVFLCEGAAWPFPENLTEKVIANLGQEVRLGIRSEDVELERNVEGSPRDGDTRAEVLLVEPLGALQLLTLQWRSWTVHAQTDRRTSWVEGQTVAMRLDMSKVHGFERSTGKALFHSASEG